MELLLGAGSRRDKQFPWQGRMEWSDLVTVDFNSDHGPDVVHDLTEMPLPFEDDKFDEIHAYHVLEHLGRQGDFRCFFAQFSEFWRILKPDGLICAICPRWNDAWAWGDPGHTRIISIESLTFLSQPMYEQVGITPMTDYRFVYKADFDAVHALVGGQQFEFVLRAVKPSRCKRVG